MQTPLSEKLQQFRTDNSIVNVGALGTVLVVTRRAKKLGLPLDSDALITEGGGQVSGLSGAAINRILKEHGGNRFVGTESGRTSRGTPNLARTYAAFLNGLHQEGLASLDEIEVWWVERFEDLFNTEPFGLNHDQSKSFITVLQDLLDQALERQRKSPGKTYVGAVLQHLVGAKIELAVPAVKLIHHGFSVADSASDRSGDFDIDDVCIHCTTAPSEGMLKKCKANLQAGKRPIILTLAKMIGAAEGLAESLGIEGRVEIMDALQFVTTNLYELSFFKSSERRVTLERLVEKYNEIVSAHENDQSLLIRIS
jgi:hypothetical protein